MAIHAVKEPRLGVKLAAFPYQDAAAEHVRELEYAAVFHEQGLGKTKIGVDVLMWWLQNQVVDSVIIVTKRSLLQNWKDELREHTYIEARVLDQDRSANYRAFNTPARVYLTHYEVFVSERKRLELFLRTRDVGIVLDEAHRIKNPSTGVSLALHGLRTGFKRRLIMTGTPVANRPQDLWSQIFFLDGGEALGRDYADFTSRVNLTNDLGVDVVRRRDFEQSLEAIPERLARFCVRETKETAGIELPPKTFEAIYVDLEHRQREIYDRYVEELQHVVVRDGTPVLDDAEEVLKRLTRLIQVASNPRLIDEGYTVECGKMAALRRLVGEAADIGEKTIVWTGFIRNARWLAEDLHTFGAIAVHGDMDLAARNAALRAFKTDPDCKVLVATPGAAKEGLTLTVANHAIFFDRSLSLEDYLQAQDRIHRITQTRPCTVTSLVAAGTVDEWVDALLSSKHGAARLAQGDVNAAAFQGEMSYDYGRILQNILDAAGGNRGGNAP
jgi:SNF2 family DNA or RNA helicase